MALYEKSEVLTDAETKDFFEFYPEYTQTCAYDGYKNENLDGAIRLMSFSLQLNPLSSRKVDYISMLSDAIYIGEGMLDEDIKKELNALLMEEARNGNLFRNEKHIEKVSFYLDILSDENRTLFWGHAANTHEISPDLVTYLKHMMICVYGCQGAELPQYDKPAGFPTFLSTNQPDWLVDNFQFKTRLEEKLETAVENEKRLIFRFLSKHVTNKDSDGCISMIANGTEDVAARAIWVIGQAGLIINENMVETFKDVFDRKNHRLIGVLATAIGKLGTNQFNDLLISSLRDFEFNSRRRIVWCMGRLASPEFKEILENLDVEENNFALKEELEHALTRLSKN